MSIFFLYLHQIELQATTEMKKEVRRETSALFRQEKMKERHQTRRKKGEATITNQVNRFAI